MTTTSTKQGRRQPRGYVLQRAMAGIRGSVTGGRRFVRQVLAELKKVVRPTRTELITYTSVVLVFVVLVMAFVSVLDYGFGRLVLWTFGGESA